MAKTGTKKSQRVVRPENLQVNLYTRPNARPPNVSIYQLLGAYCDARKRTAGKDPALAAPYGRKQ